MMTKKEMDELDKGAEDLANHIDSWTLLKYLKAGRVLDNKKVPLIGRFWYDPETDEIKGN